MIRRSLFLLAVASTAAMVSAQTQWKNPQEAGFLVVQNQAWPEEIGKTYVRLPDRAEKMVRKPLWDLSRNSAGLAINFKTDAPAITVRYTVDGPHAMPHMPATGVTGVDVYRVGEDGVEDFCFGSYSFGDTITYRYSGLPEGLAEYHMNLPLFNTITWMEVGTPEGSAFEFLPRNEEKPVVVYGTSIAHGACSSRPGMGWVNIMRRALDMPVVNLGFSGNGRLEPEMISLISEIDAELYVLDCMPNLTTTPDETVEKLVLDAVHQLRAKSNAPILLVEHAGYSNGETNAHQKKTYTRLNASQRKAFDKLQAEGVGNLYYITRGELGFSPDAWVDYVHPSDLGAQRQADVVGARVKAILNR